MWAQGHEEYSAWSYKSLLLGQASRVLTTEISLGVQGKLLAEGMMSTVHRLARAYCLSTHWTGASSAG
jgi:hypothetical protein